jgi:uncharacterized protein (TIGR03118 family)
MSSIFTRTWLRAALIAVAACCFAAAAHAKQEGANAYTVRNLVSDGSIPAEHSDPLLVNPWGIAFNTNPNGFVWVANNGSGASTLYDGNGVQNSLIVSIPGGAPTGITFNTTGDFPVSNGTASGSSAFIFVTENGIIAGWSPGVDRLNALIAVDNSETTGAIYKGVAIAAAQSGNRLYATDFFNGRVDVFDNNYAPMALGTDAFTDSRIPAGFAPFGIRNIGGNLYVTYARQDAEKEDDVAGPGLGFVDVYDPEGNLVKRLIRHGKLNAPWGLALAPADFGRFSNMLLVGNFGDGTINAFDPENGSYRGTLKANKRPIVLEGLWGIDFGNGFRDQPMNTLFFAAGPADETKGLYGRIDVDPDAGPEPDEE